MFHLGWLVGHTLTKYIPSVQEYVFRPSAETEEQSSQPSVPVDPATTVGRANLNWVEDDSRINLDMFPCRNTAHVEISWGTQTDFSSCDESFNDSLPSISKATPESLPRQDDRVNRPIVPDNDLSTRNTLSTVSDDEDELLHVLLSSVESKTSTMATRDSDSNFASDEESSSEDEF